MSFIERYRILSRVHNKIKTNATGSPEDFARSIGKSKRCTYNILDELKEMGADIRYSKPKQSYEYLNDFDMELKIDGKNIKGGKKSNFSTKCRKMHSNNLTL